MAARIGGDCASCGSHAGAFAGVVACVARSYWRSSARWLLEDVRLWQVWLCDQCRRTFYIGYLSERRLDARRSLKDAAVGFAVLSGMATAGWLLVPVMRDWYHRHPFGAKVIAIVFGFIVLAAVIALLKAPFHAVRLLVASRRLREMKETGVIPGAMYEKTAEAAAKKILDELEKSHASPPPGFELPKFMKSDEYPAELRASKPSSSERAIRASAGTREKLEAKLLTEEKQLLVESDKAVLVDV